MHPVRPPPKKQGHDALLMSSLQMSSLQMEVQEWEEEGTVKSAEGIQHALGGDEQLDVCLVCHAACRRPHSAVCVCVCVFVVVHKHTHTHTHPDPDPDTDPETQTQRDTHTQIELT